VSPLRPRVILSLAATMILAESGAHAAGVGFPPSTGWYVLPGATVAGATHSNAPLGFVAGGEVSAAYLSNRTFLWGGGYVDGVYDMGERRARVSIGPEFGWAALGLDGGMVVRPRPGGVDLGGEVRSLLAFGFGALYVRAGLMPRASADRSFGEVGLLLKLPISLTP
jgi:hypothetical protein